ncbi:YcaO-like family protein [Sphingomonas sp. RS6]
MICESTDLARLTPQIRSLAQRTMSPLTGVTRSVGVFLGNREEPRFVVAGAELTGMHVIQGRNPPSRSMHIGGCGATPSEAMLPALAEALERYAQLHAGMRPARSSRFASWQAMADDGMDAIAPDGFRYFTDDQQRNERHPFRHPGPDDPLHWTQGLSLVSGNRVHAPSQLLFLGYTPQTQQGEPWIAPAVTTGTAVHIAPLPALRNAMLELTQLDCAMGHWYGNKPAIRIGSDARTRRIDKTVARLTGRFATAHPQFYFLPNADLSGFTVACLMSDRTGTPAAVVGLGSDTRLEEAMYKAFSESSGIYQLAKLILLQEQEASGGAPIEIDTDGIYDLDLNVVFYAQSRNGERLRERFQEGPTISASQLPADSPEPAGADIATLIEDYRRTGKELLYYDLTTPDLRSVGFYAIRVWSPDTISLSLPSVPAMGHPRLNAYGGARFDAGVHPYP